MVWPGNGSPGRESPSCGRTHHNTDRHQGSAAARGDARTKIAALLPRDGWLGKLLTDARAHDLCRRDRVAVPAPV